MRGQKKSLLKVLPSEVPWWHTDLRKDVKGYSRQNITYFSTMLGSDNKKQTKKSLRSPHVEYPVLLKLPHF